MNVSSIHSQFFQNCEYFLIILKKWAVEIIKHSEFAYSNPRGNRGILLPRFNPHRMVFSQ
nr:MAG TPA: hypothetical protein [Caudoviricetes sp.]